MFERISCYLSNLFQTRDQPEHELIIINSIPGTIRLEDGTLIVVEEYDHDAVRDRYFSELSDDQIMEWLNEEGQVEENPDHLPYEAPLGF